MAESHNAADMDVINAVSNAPKPSFSPLDLHLLAKCKATERENPPIKLSCWPTMVSACFWARLSCPRARPLTGYNGGQKARSPMGD